MEKEGQVKHTSGTACKSVWGNTTKMPYLLILFLIATVTCPLPARSEEELFDTVVVKGTTLKGNVLKIGRKGIEFETQYGRGTIHIRFEDLEDIETEGLYLILFEDDREVKGRIVGIEYGHLLVGEEPASATRVPIQTLVAGVSYREAEKSFIYRLRHKYRYWRAHFDLGLEWEEGAVDKRKITLGLGINRRKVPTRLFCAFDYKYETTETQEEIETVDKDEFQGLILGEYDLRKKVFLFVLPAAERDEPRGISFRAYPTGGIGYRFLESDKGLVQLQLGAGYVYESFGSFGRNEYVCWHISMEGRYEFWRGIELGSRIMYLPGVRRFREDRLFRWEVDFTVPVVDPLAMKVKFTGVHDNNPSPEVGDNKTTMNVALSLRF